MNYSIHTTPVFKKLFKKLWKKHPLLKSDLQKLIGLLKEKPDLGIHIGHGIHKIRWASSSKGQGKLGGLRVVTYLINEKKEVYLVHIYDKGQIVNMTKKQILEILIQSGLKEANK